MWLVNLSEKCPKEGMQIHRFFLRSRGWRGSVVVKSSTFFVSFLITSFVHVKVEKSISFDKLVYIDNSLLNL